jgi:hypothetical protein
MRRVRTHQCVSSFPFWVGTKDKRRSQSGKPGVNIRNHDYVCRLSLTLIILRSRPDALLRNPPKREEPMASVWVPIILAIVEICGPPSNFAQRLVDSIIQHEAYIFGCCKSACFTNVIFRAQVGQEPIIQKENKKHTGVSITSVPFASNVAIPVTQKF